MNISNKQITILGVGYVGLPLAIAFSKKYKTIGYDVNPVRIGELKKYQDRTREVNNQELEKSIVQEQNQLSIKNGLYLTSNINDLTGSDIFIVTVPTPVNSSNIPDLTILKSCTELVGSILDKGNIVIYESTVYPGATEEICVPILEQKSRLKYNQDFFVGYSPERINPGDKERRLENIIKVTSGSTAEIAQSIDQLYASIIPAGTYKAKSIKIAEAAKVIENTQRDINIAFINELSKIFELLEINTYDVLEAASTKWNFLKFEPGLVGGHCIGVDPYYLAQKAQELKFNPEMILSGRRTNESMSSNIANRIIKKLIKRNTSPTIETNVLIMGFTFKENCPDFRNTKIIDLYNDLKEYGLNVSIYDPLVYKQDVLEEYNINLIDTINKEFYDVVIVAVKHDSFYQIDIQKFLKVRGFIFDLKNILKEGENIFKI